jgi:hypothetical protein
MPVAVNQPHARDEESPLDRIAKGLQIASSVYGIVDAKHKAIALAEQQKQDNLFKQQELDTKAKEANKPKEVDPMVAALRAQQLQDAQQRSKDATEKAAFDKSVEGRQAKLGTEGKQRLDNARAGLIAIQGMAGALQNGSNTFSLVGDNDFTQQRAMFEESLGRMQSGGAISKPEEERFKKMAPTLFDTSEMRSKKLQSLQGEFATRINTLGFKPEELGVERTDVALKPPSNSFKWSTPAANAAAPVAGPKAGEEDGGYVFMGGNPADQKNWKKK